MKEDKEALCPFCQKKLQIVFSYSNGQCGFLWCDECKCSIHVQLYDTDKISRDILGREYE